MGTDRRVELDVVHRYWAGSYPWLRALANPRVGFMTRLAGYESRLQMTLDDSGPDVTVPVTCLHCRQAVVVRVPSRNARRARQLRVRRALLVVLVVNVLLALLFVLSMVVWVTPWAVLAAVLLGLSVGPLVSLLPQGIDIDYMPNWQGDDTHVVTVRVRPPSPSARRGVDWTYDLGCDWNTSVTEEARQRAFQARVLVLAAKIDNDEANRVCAEMLHLESESPDKDITIYIDSPGGDVNAALVIRNMLQSRQTDVATRVTGIAAGAAQLVLSAGTPGKRYARPDARILLMRPSSASDATGDIADIQQLLAEMTAQDTGQPVEQVSADADRVRSFSAQEARDYGLVDQIADLPHMPNVG